MRGLKCFLTVAILLVVYGCTVETLSGYDEEGEVQTITVKGPAPINFKAIAGNIQTKGTSVRDDEALVFNWAIGDTLGIFPNKGNQVEFPISAKSGDTSASFDGGGWALRNNASYAAYYPFSVWNYHRNNETILLDYSGQVQNGNGSFAHLSAYDYLASNKTSPENSAVTFQMERQGAILYIDIVVPAPSTITALEISCDEAIFVEKASLDISGDEPVVKPVETKESLTLSFKNTETTVSNETVRAYMAVQPVDFSDKTVTATLYTSNGSYSAQVVSREVKKGSAAFLRFAGDAVAVPEAVDLGLSVKWASCNLGAISPEGYGDYYAWGETEPYYSSQNPLIWKDGKSAGYDWPSYKWCNGNYKNLTKYNTKSDYGPVDNKTVLDPEDDAVYVALGSSWRMPTEEEWTELRKNCTCTWTNNYNGTGIAGKIVTSKVAGYTDKSIFLPAAGYRESTVLFDHIESGSFGLYWSSSLDTNYHLYEPYDPWAFFFDYGSESKGGSGGRCCGYPIRPVYGARVLVTGITLSQAPASVEVDDSFVLTASITPANAAEKGVNWSSSDASIATVDNNGQVTAVAFGTAIIMATTVDGGFTATCEVTVTPAMAVPEAVDLGLSVKWASCNLGAISPEGYGDYYAWGETEPYYSSQNPLIWKDGKSAGYDWPSYKWCNGNYKNLTKYNTKSDYGPVDNKTVLDPEDDAVYVALGGKWRMPTDAEWIELRENCTWTWTDNYNGTGISGRIVTATNNNSIFLPAAGERERADFLHAGSFGHYWASSLRTHEPPGEFDIEMAWGVYFYSGSVGSGGGSRYCGKSVRPVCGDFINATGVSLSPSSAQLTEGNTVWLAVTVAPANASNPAVRWSSSNTSVATVDGNGLVSAIGPGTATITVETYDGGFTASCELTIIPVPVPEVVDLGLSVKWASFNLGASAPEEYGYYYAWAETEPKYIFSWSTYKFGTSSDGPFSKYNTQSSYGTVDNKTVLDSEDDDAHVRLGGDWRIPTDEEWLELMNNCTWTWTDNYNGTAVAGRIVTSNVAGYTDKNIFLPAAGYKEYSVLNYAGSNGYYWSSSLITGWSNLAASVFFSYGGLNRRGDYRCYGRSVRPVYGDFINATGVSLSPSSAQLSDGSTRLE